MSCNPSHSQDCHLIPEYIPKVIRENCSREFRLNKTTKRLRPPNPAKHMGRTSREIDLHQRWE